METTNKERHAEECRRMAAVTNEPRAKATWTQMAERFFAAAVKQAKAEKQANSLRRARDLTLAR